MVTFQTVVLFFLITNDIFFIPKTQVEKLEAELNRWRSGETVRLEEQVNLQEIEAVTPVTSFIEEKPPAPVSIPSLSFSVLE